jgi:hypothetical protein
MAKSLGLLSMLEKKILIDYQAQEEGHYLEENNIV